MEMTRFILSGKDRVGVMRCEQLFKKPDPIITPSTGRHDCNESNKAAAVPAIVANKRLLKQLEKESKQEGERAI